MTPENKNVKLAALAALIVGLVLTVASAFFVATADDKAAWCTALLVGLAMVVIGFSSARAINVPANAKSVRAFAVTGFAVASMALAIDLTILKSPITAIGFVGCGLVIMFALVTLAHVATKAFEKR